MKFINRKKEREELPLILDPNNLISTDKNDNILIIYGDEGNGKSCLIEKISNHMKIKKSFFTIEGSNYNKSIKEYYHVDLLWQEISKHRNKITLKLFSFPILIINMVKRILNAHSYNVLEFENSPVNNKISLIKENLKSSITPYYIFFKNAQNIEQESLDLFFYLANDLKNVLFIFEYTVSENNFERIKKEINRKVKEPQFYYIKSIDFNEIKIIFDTKKTTEDKMKMIEQDYIQCKGNIDHIIYKYGSFLKVQSHKFDYKSFDKNTKIILQIINLTNEKITITDFEKILKENKESFIFLNTDIYLSCINSLEENNFITNQNGIYILSKYLIKEISNYRKSSEGYIAYGMLIKYYNSINDNISLFRLYCMYNDNNIITILPNIKLYLMEKKYPSIILKELEILLRDINYARKLNKLETRITMFAIEMFIQIDNYERGMFYLKKIYDSNSLAHDILYAGLISIKKDFAENLIQEIDLLIEKYKKEDRISLILYLYKLKIHMEHETSANIKKVIKEISSIKEFKKYPEYCYFFRNKAEILSLDEANAIYYECLSSASNLNNPNFINEINISLAMNYAHMGNLNKSKKYNQKAEMFIGKGIREYYILNNKAVINMLNEIFTTQTLNDLEIANVLNSNPYDRIIILSNLLVCYIKMGQISKANETVDCLLSVNIREYNYEELQHIYYQNLLFYYEFKKEKKKILEYRNLIQELINSLNQSSYTYKIAQLQLNKTTDKNIFFQNILLG